MHITASVFINDDESGLHSDYDRWLEKLGPHDPIEQYRHNDTGEDNADARMKRQVMGREVIIAVTNAELDFGPVEQIFYGEFDGRRRKRVLVKTIGEQVLCFKSCEGRSMRSKSGRIKLCKVIENPILEIWRQDDGIIYQR
jgi:secondary thiamine-phosphate synthase enzyme